MALSGPLRAVASKLVTQFGQPGTLRKIVSTHDLANDSVSQAPTDYPLSVVIQDYSQVEIRGLVQQGDKKIIIPSKQLPDGVAPDAGWEIDSEGKTYRIIFAQSIVSDTQDVIYIVTARI